MARRELAPPASPGRAAGFIPVAFVSQVHTSSAGRNPPANLRRAAPLFSRREAAGSPVYSGL